MAVEIKLKPKMVVRPDSFALEFRHQSELHFKWLGDLAGIEGVSKSDYYSSRGWQRRIDGCPVPSARCPVPISPSPNPQARLLYI
jgi:hypothetical protein